MLWLSLFCVVLRYVIVSLFFCWCLFVARCVLFACVLCCCFVGLGVHVLLSMCLFVCLLLLVCSCMCVSFVLLVIACACLLACLSA